MDLPKVKENEKQPERQAGALENSINFAKDNWIIFAGIAAFGIYWYLYDEKMSANIKRQVKKIVDEAKETVEKIKTK